jgi:ZIP family zinc transporter
MHQNADRLSDLGQKNTARWMFAAAIILHNFPEGMGAGSSMAGTPLAEALVVQLGLSIQNIAEGALLVICFQSLGWSLPAALAGSIFSGVVELSGAATGGAALEWTLASLPFTLALAGGAMLMSVVLEHQERAREGAPVAAWRLIAGLVAIPLLNFFLP